jgi:hypothetical protein
MQEYELNILAAQNGFALSVQPVGSTGTAPYRTFSSWPETKGFLHGLAVSDELIDQVSQMVTGLAPGCLCKQKMFLPESVDDAISGRMDGPDSEPSSIIAA